MLKHIAIALALFTSIADAKPRRPQRDSSWMRECIAERMQNAKDNGASNATHAEARKICKSEQPDDEVAAAREQLKLARFNAKVAKAKERVRRAIEACAQAVTDRCVEFAKPDGSTDCNVDDGLRAEYELVCLAQEGK